DIQVMFAMSRFYDTVNEARTKYDKLKHVIVANVKDALPPILGFLFGLTREKKEGHAVELRPGDYRLPEFAGRFKPSDRPKVDVTGEDRGLFQYSGGTTGDPKAAVALHKNIVANTMQIRAWNTEFKEDSDIMLMAIPLFHVYGMIAGMALSIAGGIPMVMIPDARNLD